MDNTTTGDVVVKTLDSAFENYVIVRMQATVERDNFSIVGGNGITDCWMSNRKTLNVRQFLSSTTTNMKMFVDLYYVKP